MKPVFEMPYDTVAKFETVIFENVIELDIKWEYFTMINVIPNLPAKRSTGMQHTHALGNNLRLHLHITLQR